MKSTHAFVLTAVAACIASLQLHASADDSPSQPAAKADDHASGSAAEDTAAAEPEAEKQSLPDIYMEAELPQGFPTPGPAYEVQLKSYPAYRAARAQGQNAFRKLFNHINDHGIAMTAPVEMTLSTPEENDVEAQVQELDMAFMYARPDMGELGTDGPNDAVEVVDLPALQVLSLGFFGDAEGEQLTDALAMLQRHLADRPDLVAAGPPRLLGYNSPMVPARRRYHEIQIPVTSVESSPSDAKPHYPDAQTADPSPSDAPQN